MKNNSILSYYFDLKKQAKEIDTKLSEINDSAVDQAIEILSKPGDYPEHHKQTVFLNGHGRVIVSFKNKSCRIEDDEELTRMEEEINQELKILAEKNHSRLSDILIRIELLKNEILQLEEEQSDLMSSSKLTQLQEGFKTRFASLIYKVPILNVFLN
jgi:hypothetical protein